jgi:predicted MFS family arabinose efflux permease
MVPQERAPHTRLMRRYADLLRTPAVPLLLAGAVLGRFQLGMAPLAIVLLVEGATGSYARAGAAAAAHAIVGGLVGPALGRLVDRVGQTAVLLACAAGCALAYPLLALNAGAATPVVLGLSALSGAVTPPLSACLRAVWAELLRGTDRLETAFAFESTLQELTYALGPLAVAVLVVRSGPSAALIVAGACAALGTLAFAWSRPSRTWRGRPGGAGLLGPLRSRGVRVLLGVAVGNAAAFGAIEVTVPAFAERAGDPALAGWLLAVWSLGSLLSGLAYGARRWSSPPWPRLVVLLALHSGMVALLALPGTPSLLGLALLGVGLTVAPWIACSYLLLDASAPTGTVTEAFTWLAAAFAAGIAVGNATAGAVVQRAGTGPGFALAAAFGLLALLVPAASLTRMRRWRSLTASEPT